MKEIVMDRATPYFPQEIIINILKRLPVKSLVRFQGVCKDWNNLFKNPFFITEHLHHSTHQSPCLLFERIKPRRLCLLNHDMQVLEYQIAPFTNPSTCTIVPSSSNGLVCLEFKKNKSLCVWNPATREIHHVARPLSPHRGGESSYYIGFGFSPIVNDYKIVRIFSNMNVHVTHKVEVFSLTRRLWKKVEVGKLEGIILTIPSCGFTFDGAIFWFAFKLDLGEDGFRVASFDIATEAFTLIPFPKSAHKSNQNKLTTYENKLAMLSRYNVENMESSWIDLWVMDKRIDASEETCIWTKIYTSNPYPSSLHPVTIWRNEIVCKVNEMRASIREGKVVLENEDGARLVFCNLHTNEFKEFGQCSFNTPIWNYAESLMSDPAPRRSLRMKRP